MTIQHLNPAWKERLDAARRAKNRGLSTKDIEDLADWLCSGQLAISAEKDRTEVAAALLRLQQSYNALHDYTNSINQYGLFIGCKVASSLTEKTISFTQAARAVMKLKAEGRLYILGDRHD